MRIGSEWPKQVGDVQSCLLEPLETGYEEPLQLFSKQFLPRALMNRGVERRAWTQTGFAYCDGGGGFSTLSASKTANIPPRRVVPPMAAAS
jgi:hypothetical protein